MFVGVGASRVRDLFEQAKQNSPCIIFMDEIDAVGRHRGAGMGGGHDEREQTLNQLLVEMDGFEMKDNIILIAATNRPDILDPPCCARAASTARSWSTGPTASAARRSSTCTRRGKPMAAEVDLEALAGQTPGLHRRRPRQPGQRGRPAGRPQGQEADRDAELEEGIMRVIAGPEKKTRLLSPKEREITAVHEMGHALVGHYLEHNDPVHKISIVGRGMALGYVVTLPSEDKFMRSRAELMDPLAKNLGGRTAEELVFGEVTTGAEDDLNKTTDTAKRMVTRWGMSEKLGPRTFGRDSSQPFLGRDFGHEADYSEEIAREIDDEIRRDRRGRARARPHSADRAHRGAAAPVQDPDRVRDDRPRAVPAAAGRRARRGRSSRTRRATAAADRRRSSAQGAVRGRARSGCRSRARLQSKPPDVAAARLILPPARFVAP